MARTSLRCVARMEPTHAPLGGDAAFVSTGTLPPVDLVTRLVTEAHARFGTVALGAELAGLSGARARAERAVRHLRRRHRRACLRGRRRRARLHDHERLEAVRVRAGLRPDRRDGRARASGRERHGLCLQLAGRHRAQRRTAAPTRWSTPAPSRRPAWCRATPKRTSGASSTRACRASPAARCSLNEEVYASASETNFRNRSIARMLQSIGRIYCDPAEATDLYTRQCSLNVSAQGPRGDGRDARRWRRQSGDAASRSSIPRSATTRSP